MDGKGGRGEGLEGTQEVRRLRVVKSQLSPIFGERWLLAYFVFPNRCFASLDGGEVRFGAEGSQFVEGRHLSPISSEGGLQPIVCFQPAISVGEGLVSGSVARWSVFWLCRQVLVSNGIVRSCFSSACGPGYPGCVIKG